MKQLKLYTEYLRDEAITRLIPIGNLTEFSGGELVVGDKVGAIFAVVSEPLRHSYFLSNKIFRWFTTETTIEFYNSIMLSFPSNYSASNKTLYLFARHPNDARYIFLGSLRVARGDGFPSTYRTSELPTHIITELQIEPILPPEVWIKFDWSTEQILINGLPLPQTLLALITQNRWIAPSEITPYQEVFAKNEMGGWFFTPDQMERDTYDLRRQYQDGHGDDYGLCEIDDGSNTKLVLSKAISLGSTGPEELFCLDYRHSKTEPCVVYLGGNYPHWKMIAPNFETFARKLGL